MGSGLYNPQLAVYTTYIYTRYILPSTVAGSIIPTTAYQNQNNSMIVSRKLHSCKLTCRHEKYTILDGIYQEKMVFYLAMLVSGKLMMKASHLGLQKRQKCPVNTST